MTVKALRRPIGIAIELLAGIPSIIYGIWGLFVFAPFVQTYTQPALIAAPLLFTALNNQFWSSDLNAPMASLPVVIFQFRYRLTRIGSNWTGQGPY